MFRDIKKFKKHCYSAIRESEVGVEIGFRIIDFETYLSLNINVLYLI